MAHSFSALYGHIIFSTLGRHPWLTPDRRDELWSCLGGIARDEGQKPLAVGGFDDHVHMLVSLTRTARPCDVVRAIKANSSGWAARAWGLPEFAWQGGYSIFSVCPSRLADVKDYIARQEEHHRTKSSLDELRAFLDAHGVDYDERDLSD